MTAREVNIIVAGALIIALGLAITAISNRPAHGEQRRASSTSYSQDLKNPPRSYRRYKYRYSYRRSRSRTAAVNPRVAPSVVEPASREVSLGGANVTIPLVGTPAGQLLLTGDWPAIALMPPYQKPFEMTADPFAHWTGGGLMLEREGEEVPARVWNDSLHFAALGAITAAFVALCFYVVIGGQHERPATPQWPFGPDA